MSAVIKLGGESFDVSPLPYGVLRKVLPAIGRVGEKLQRQQFDDDLLADLAQVIAPAVGKTSAEFDAMTMDMQQIVAAFGVVVEASGLAPKSEGSGAGEA